MSGMKSVSRFIFFFILVIIAALSSSKTSTYDVVPINNINEIEEWAKKHALDYRSRCFFTTAIKSI